MPDPAPDPAPAAPAAPPKPAKPRRPRRPKAPTSSTPDPGAGAPDSSSPPAHLEAPLGHEGDADELPEGLPVLVELDAPDGLDADELPAPEDDRDPDPDDLHPFAARFHSRGIAQGHVCPRCAKPTTPVTPGHTYCAPCGSHWTLAHDQA